MKRILSTLLCVFCIAFISSCSKDSQKLILLDTTWANDNSLVSVNKITFETSSMCTMRIGGTNQYFGYRYKHPDITFFLPKLPDNTSYYGTFEDGKLILNNDEDVIIGIFHKED